ncbi:MAG: GNAT family N-acetyltransferase/peptidase C39 family protein [Rhodospirillaceae bacterium]
MTIRDATLRDIPALDRLERTCFDSDRLSPRSFRNILQHGNAALIVDDDGDSIAGYGLILFHRNTSMARLYSFAVDPGHRRRGIAKRLLQRGEEVARERGWVSMRLEVRADNAAAIRFYEKEGYQKFSTYPDYYEDHMDALRMEKALVGHLPLDLAPVPYYPQSLEFTCGPACLMMAMKALDPEVTLDRTLEMRLWREATTVFMTSGHGGCGPFGMALSLWRRGFEVEVHVSEDIELFVEGVRDEDKKEVIRLVHSDFLSEIENTDIRLNYGPLSLADIRARFDQGRIPIILVSSYRLTGSKAPHWMVITGFDEHYVYLHEPYVDVEVGETETVCIGIPIANQEFERMARYGRSKQYALLLGGPKRESAT